MEVYLLTKKKIDFSIIKKVAKELRALFTEDILPKDMPIAAYKSYSEGTLTTHQYKFLLNLPSDQEEIEKMVGVFYHCVEEDFEIEIEEDIEEVILEDEYEEPSDIEKHTEWMNSKFSDGWRYGMHFNEQDKTDPRLRPFYQLSDKQRKTMPWQSNR